MSESLFDKLHLAELDQLLWYAEQAQKDGSYYGNRVLFAARHKRIVVALTELITFREKEASDE